MIPERGIVIVVKAFVIQMALKITVLILQSEETFEGFNIGKILVC